MYTHHKELLVTGLSCVFAIAVVHGGLWFHLLGVPEYSVLGYPFHYFWFVAGAPVALFVVYVVYDRLAARIDEQKRREQPRS